MSCVLDTNLLIYFLDEVDAPEAMARVEDAIRNGARFSVITRMEILGWRGHTESSRRHARNLLDRLHEISLTSVVVDKVIEIRSASSMKLPDAIIAASALAEALPLMTRNTADFRSVAALSLIDPFST